MANTIFTPTKPLQTNKPKEHHYIRTPLASLFGFFAVALIMLSIIVVWVGRTVTDTNTYVRTVSPLVTDVAVQNFVVSKLTTAINENDGLPIRDIAGQVLGADKLEGKTDEQLKVEVSAVVEDSLRGIITSPSFAKLWKDSNTSIHSQLIAQLEGDSKEVKLDFHPVIVGVLDQLDTTQFAFLKDKLQLRDDAGIITLQSEQLGTIKDAYDKSKLAMLSVVAAAVVFTALCIWTSVNHLRTARRILILTGIYSLILALLLDATRFFKPGGMGEIEQQFAVALVQGITHDLQLILYVLAAAGILLAIGSKIYSTYRLRRLAKSGKLSSVK